MHDVDLDVQGKLPDMRQEDTYSKTFGRPGIYGYGCDIPPFMKGKAIVK